MTDRRPLLLLLLLLVGSAGCANPVPPTGGPADDVPPSIQLSEPEAGAVLFAGDRLRIHFSEYINQPTLLQALSINPEPDGRLEYVWNKRTVEIRFPEGLRENTTYVVTIDAKLRDVHGVALRQPITLAFSTGPTINQGKLAGRVLDPATSAGVPEMDVFAYRRADSTAPALPIERPDYRTQTGADGTFAFFYLSEDPYYVIALEDRNRNRRPDPLERFAVPPVPVIFADSLGSQALPAPTLGPPPPFPPPAAPGGSVGFQPLPEGVRERGLTARLGPWLAAVTDTVPPSVQRLRPLSRSRLEVRFAEAVSLVPPDTLWRVRSDAGADVGVKAVYALPEQQFSVYLKTDSLVAGAAYSLTTGTVADSSGNRARPEELTFTAPAASDTLTLRFQKFVPDRITADTLVGLAPGEAFGAQFNTPAPQPSALFSLQDSLGRELAFSLRVENGTTYYVRPDSGAPAVLRLRVAGADTVHTRLFQRLSARALGELSGFVALPDRSAVAVVELYRAASRGPAPLRTTTADSTGAFVFNALPEDQYRLRAFLDRNRNEKWDGGSVFPYEPAEAVAWGADSVRVRARWETATEDTLRFLP